MWFLIKGAFWFSLVLLLLPIFGPDDTTTTADRPAEATTGVDIGRTVSVATEALGYIGAICLEKPEVCDEGAETFTALGHRAKEGARIAYQLLDAQFGTAGDSAAPAGPGDPVTTGTVAKGLVTPAAAAATPGLPVDAALADGNDLGVSRIPVPERRIAPEGARF